MNAIRTLIVDDEPLAREGLRALLAGDAEIEVIGEAGRGADAVRAIVEQRPELVFLDVQMPEMDGFEVLAKLPRDRLPVVVFVTAHDRYALRAFEVHAVDYLLKPFDDERFAKALEQAKHQLRQQQAHDLSHRLLDLVQESRGNGEDRVDDDEPAGVERLVVRSGGRVVFLDVDEIDWIEAADYYVKLHTGTRAYLLRESMNKLEAQLDPRSFCRIHRSTIVNLDRVRELRSRPNGEGFVYLKDGTELRHSRSRREQLKMLLNHNGRARG